MLDAGDPQDALRESDGRSMSTKAAETCAPESTASVSPAAQGNGLLLQSGSINGCNLARPRIQTKASTTTSTHQPYVAPQFPTRPSVSRAASIARSVTYARRLASDTDDNASLLSIRSSMPDGGRIEDLLGSSDDPSIARSSSPTILFPVIEAEDIKFRDDFEHEFDTLEELASDGSNEESLVLRWRSKLKQFLILSSAGKPIYSRHGDDQLISNSVGVIQTIISFFLNSGDTLRSFTAGKTRFEILSKGHMHLVAISRIGESDVQLRAQLEALYTQILSALTLPRLQQMFINRPSTDLRRPLEGNASLLSALADDFTRGSPSGLLSALECLRMRKTQREVVNQSMVKCRCPNLLYGLIVGANRLVSVIRPKKHSLHPGDLQLIFSMLFRARSIRGGGGENWIPLCLPGFNNTGYIYMYVTFLEDGYRRSSPVERLGESTDADDDVVIVLISPNRDSFDEMRQMRDDLVSQLEKNGSLGIIRSSMSSGRPSCTDLVPSNTIRHFLYKSKANVQFFMPKAEAELQSPYAWRKLMSLYSSLHASTHGRLAHLKLHYLTTEIHSSLAWITPTFELYCIAGPDVTRDVLARAAGKLEYWSRKEQERLFIIGGATF